MKSLRIKAWFKATPKYVVIDSKRVEHLGIKNLEKLTRNSLKYKTSILVTPQSEGVFKGNDSLLFTQHSKYATEVVYKHN